MTTGPSLVTAAMLREMPPEAVAKGPVVRVRGTLTYLAVQPSLLFMQDDSGAICVTGPREPGIRRFLKPGVLLEIEGIVTPGRGGPYLSARGKEPLPITVIESGAVIQPRPTTVAELLSPQPHGDLVEVRGVCRSIRTESFGPLQDAMIVTIAEAGRRLEIAYLNWNATATIPNAWVGSTLRVRGVFNSVLPDRQQVASMRLLVGAMRDATVVKAAAAADSIVVAPTTSIDTHGEPQQVRIQGVVTVPISGKGMYVQDASGGVWIETPPVGSAVASKPGEKLDVIGFPAFRDGATSLEDVILRPLGKGSLPPPQTVTADQAISGTFNARLVQMDALVLEVSRLAEGSTLVLQAGERVFLARVAATSDDGRVLSATENSWVRVAGVCVNNRSPVEPPVTAGAQPRPVSFHLMLAGSDAISVIRTPNWWTLERVLFVIGVLLLAALAAMAWVIALRRRVTQQTVQIRQHVSQGTLNEERMRIARELHDSLEQDLLGITMQLKATEKLLDRPERAKSALQLASAMVRRSQAETHRAVWDLRERKAGQGGLVATLRSALAGLTTGGMGGGPAIEVDVTGEERELPPQTENHILRVALESVTNAFKHAQANTVWVKVDFEPERVVLEVRDDGKGFDADNPPLPNSGHFGLFGMNERAAKLHGTLTVASRPNEGSTIRLVAPTTESK